MTGRGRIPVDGVYTHKQNRSFVGQRATLYNQFKLYYSWYPTQNLFSSNEHCGHCVMEPLVVCWQYSSFFQHYNLYSKCFYIKAQQNKSSSNRWMTDCIEVEIACILFGWSNPWTNEGRGHLLKMYEIFAYFNSFLTIIKRFYRVK